MAVEYVFIGVGLAIFIAAAAYLTLQSWDVPDDDA
jgi:hypothetical protein